MIDNSMMPFVDFIGLVCEWPHGDDVLEGRVISQSNSYSVYAMTDEGRVFDVPLKILSFLDPDMVEDRVESYRKTVMFLEQYRDDVTDRHLSMSLHQTEDEIPEAEEPEEPEDDGSGQSGGSSGPSGMDWN